MEKQIGGVLASYYNKTLLISNNRYYIIKGSNKVGSEIEFDTSDAIPMPSYMFAIAAMNEEDLDSTLDYIHSKWFDKNN